MNDKFSLRDYPLKAASLYVSALSFILENTIHNYGQFIQWGIYNIRSNVLTTGLEVDVERTLKAWQCPGLSNTYEIWR